MHELPGASTHVKRHLSRRELATIAVALEVVADLDAPITIERGRAALCVDEALLDEAAIRALAYELWVSRKVKVCRSKRKPA